MIEMEQIRKYLRFLRILFGSMVILFAVADVLFFRAELKFYDLNQVLFALLVIIYLVDLFTRKNNR
jgi:hypothetical protein